MISAWVSIIIGIAVLIGGYLTSIMFVPKKSENPNVTLFHLRYVYLVSFTLIIAGLILIILGVCIMIILRTL